MAFYTVQAPNGTSYTIQGPDGASQDDVQNEVLRQHPEAAGDQGTHRPQSLDSLGDGTTAPTGSAAAHAAQSPISGMSNAGLAVAGMGKAFNDVGVGAQQLAANFQGGAQDAALGEAGMPTTLPTATSRSAQLRQQVANQRKLDEQLMSTNAGKAGEILGQLAMVAAAPGGLVGTMAAGAASGATTPVAGNESQGQNAAMGVIMGAAGHAAGTLLGKVVGGIAQPFRTTSREAIQDQADLLLSHDVPLSSTQQGAGKLSQTMSNMVADNPLVGSNLSTTQQSAFTKAVLQQVGINADSADKVAMATRKVQLGKEFDNWESKYNVTVDQPLLNRLANIEFNAGNELLPDQAKILSKHIDNIIDKASGNGQMSGPAVGEARTALMRLQGSQDMPTLGQWAGEVHDALSDALMRAATPADQQAIKATRTQYRALMQVQDAIGSDDQIAPAALYQRLDRANNVSEMVYGMGPNQNLVDLAQAGKNIFALGKTPNSGTAQRIAGMLAVGSSLAAVDGVARGDPKEAMKVGLLGLGAPTMAKLITENPQSARMIAQWARSKVLQNFRSTVKTEGQRLIGGLGVAATPSVNTALGEDGDNEPNQ